MAENDLVHAAAEELYADDPAGFTQRRADLVAQARAAGDRAAATSIAALRKPTRAAWTVNRLVRADPSVPSRLSALGDDLRAAERALNGRRLRELSQARRDLIAALTRQALAGAGQHPAPVALADEVTATLTAAVADPQVAEQLAAGTLVRPVERSGFGLGLAPGEDAGHGRPATEHQHAERTRAGRRGTVRDRAVRDRTDRSERDRAGRQQAQRERAQREGADRERADRERADRERAELERARQERAERERQRQAMAAAERALTEADQAAEAARAAERDRAEAVSRLEEQLGDARDGLADARRRTREAVAAQRRARKALDRLGGQPAPAPRPS